MNTETDLERKLNSLKVLAAVSGLKHVRNIFLVFLGALTVSSYGWYALHKSDGVFARYQFAAKEYLSRSDFEFTWNKIETSLRSDRPEDINEASIDIKWQRKGVEQVSDTVQYPPLRKSLEDMDKILKKLESDTPARAIALSEKTGTAPQWIPLLPNGGKSLTRHGCH